MKKISIDVNSQCVGCRQCQLSCSLAKEGCFAPWLSRIKINRNQNLVLSKPVTCQQCKDAPCAASCPVEGVFSVDKSTGVLYINQDECIGCRQCVDACPFDAIVFNQSKYVAAKCDLCGGNPVCIGACCAEVLKVGEVE